MTSVREKVIQHFALKGDPREPDQELGDALYVLLYSLHLEDTSVEGWHFFRVTKESTDSLAAVGLMTLLPSGTVPIEMAVQRVENELSWSVQLGRMDSDWLQMSDSKQWKAVYLYATGDRDTPEWTWGRQYQGSVPLADA